MLTRYKITLSIRGGRTEIHEADSYNINNGVLHLFTNTKRGNKIKIFPLVDISEIETEDKSA